MKDYFKNGWNWVHLFGSFILTDTLFNLTPCAGIIAFFLGFLWECADQCKKRFKWDIWFFDSSGFDWRDLLMDLVGIILATWLIN